MRRLTISLALLLPLLALTWTALAVNGYDLGWWTVDGGGGTVDDSVYRLSGTLGQPDAGPVLAGVGYTLYGGFWYGAVAPAGYAVYLPVVLR